MLTYRKTTITTIADGSATAYSEPLNGLLHAIYFQDVDTANTVDITVTDETTGAAVLTVTDLAASARYQPRDLADDLAGADRAGIATRVPVSGRLKFVLAQGGDTKSLHAHIYVDER